MCACTQPWARADFFPVGGHYGCDRDSVSKTTQLTSQVSSALRCSTGTKQQRIKPISGRDSTDCRVIRKKKKNIFGGHSSSAAWRSIVALELDLHNRRGCQVKSLDARCHCKAHSRWLSMHLLNLYKLIMCKTKGKGLL